MSQRGYGASHAALPKTAQLAGRTAGRRHGRRGTANAPVLLCRRRYTPARRRRQRTP